MTESTDDAAFHDGTVLSVIAIVKITAKRCGYAVAWHGSLARDIDLIACPWTESAKPPEVLVERIVDAVKGWVNPARNNPLAKPHGRLAWTIYLLGTGVMIDLSVMPLLPDTTDS